MLDFRLVVELLRIAHSSYRGDVDHERAGVFGDRNSDDGVCSSDGDKDQGWDLADSVVQRQWAGDVDVS